MSDKRCKKHTAYYEPCIVCKSENISKSASLACYVPKPQEIEDIIQYYVNIEEGNYGWGGQEYILTDVDKAACKILELIQDT